MYIQLDCIRNPARAVPPGSHRYFYSSASCLGIRMREYVYPTSSLGIRCGGDSHPKIFPPGSVGLAQAHPLPKSAAMRKQPSAGLGPVTAHPTHFSFGPRFGRIEGIKCIQGTEGRTPQIKQSGRPDASYLRSRHTYTRQDSDGQIRTSVSWAGRAFSLLLPRPPLPLPALPLPPVPPAVYRYRG